MPVGPGHQPETTGETPEGTQQEASSGAGWLRGQGCGQVLGGFMGAHAGPTWWEGLWLQPHGVSDDCCPPLRLAAGCFRRGPCWLPPRAPPEPALSVATRVTFCVSQAAGMEGSKGWHHRGRNVSRVGDFPSTEEVAWPRGWDERVGPPEPPPAFQPALAEQRLGPAATICWERSCVQLRGPQARPS